MIEVKTRIEQEDTSYVERKNDQDAQEFSNSEAFWYRGTPLIYSFITKLQRLQCPLMMLSALSIIFDGSVYTSFLPIAQCRYEVVQVGWVYRLQ